MLSLIGMIQIQEYKYKFLNYYFIRIGDDLNSGLAKLV